MPKGTLVRNVLDLPVSPKLSVLVTGNLGFVGSATQKYLFEKGCEVIGYDIMEGGGDIRDFNKLEECIKEFHPNRILHLAAIARFADADANPILTHETNVLGTMNVVMLAKKYHIPIVFSSTGSVYMPVTETPLREDMRCIGNSQYGVTKFQAELYVRSHTPHIVLRYAHLYGKEKRMHGLIGGFLDRINRGLAPELYGGKQSNDFTYIKDVARANYLALIAPWDKWNQIYNIGTGEELSALEAGQKICKIMKYKGKIETKEQRTVDPSRFVFDCSKAERMLNFKAEYNFEAGLEDMLNE